MTRNYAGLAAVLSVMVFVSAASCQQTRPTGENVATMQDDAVKVAATQPAATQPAEVEEVVAAQPAEEAVAVDPEVEMWLDRIEKRSGEIKTLSAKLRYDFVQGLQGDEQRRFGRLVYVAGPPAKFAVHFDRLLVDEAIREQDRWLIYDGVWLVERNEDKKQFFKRQVGDPNEQGEDGKDALAIGEGPFVVPIGGKKVDILRRFTVSIIEDGGDAPKRTENTVHLRLTPRPSENLDFTYLDMWYDKEQLLAVRIETYKEASEDEKIFVLWETQVNQEIDEKVIDTAEPQETGWDVEVTPWRE